jgi:hypothetical protein
MLHTGGIEKRKDANIFNMFKENLKNLMNKIYLFAKLSFKTGGGKDFFFFIFIGSAAQVTRNNQRFSLMNPAGSSPTQKSFCSSLYFFLQIRRQ